MKTVKLVVAYKNRTISIPFKNIALIDDFTTFYDNADDIGTALNEILSLNLNDTRISRIYICRTTKKEGSNYEYNEILPVRYSFDKYIQGSVEENYIDYILKHQELLFESHTPLNIIMNNYTKKYDKVYLNEFDITRIATLYLKSDKGTYNYERMRAAYFTLLKNGYKIKIQKNTSNNPYNRTDLTKYNSRDEFFEYLAYYSTLGEEEKAKTIEFLSGESLENIDRNMSNPNYGLFDTKDIKYREDYHDDALLLQALTNMPTEDLIAFINDYQNITKGKTK